MNIYNLLKPALFCTNPDKAHKLTLNILKHLPQTLCKQMYKTRVIDQTNCFGLTFTNKVGLAPGFDKNGVAINALLALGFGFLELGGVTPEPQVGNPYPHVLRIPKYNSLINHCGLNNFGVKQLKTQLQKPRLPGLIGVNIAANKTTPIEQSYKDYGLCLSELYAHCDYISANISCPNVKGKDPQKQLTQGLHITEHLCEQRLKEQQTINIYKPILIKISPDTDKQSLNLFLNEVNKLPIDGIICGNTTKQRPPCLKPNEAEFWGGLSGELLSPIMQQQLTKTRETLNKDKNIIAVGGIDSSQTAKQSIDNGASLIQIYTSLVYQGPNIIKQLATALSES